MLARSRSHTILLSLKDDVKTSANPTAEQRESVVSGRAVRGAADPFSTPPASTLPCVFAVSLSKGRGCHPLSLGCHLTLFGQ